MTDLISRIRTAQVRAAEDAVIAGVPPALKKLMDDAQRRHEEKGGCPGCGSMIHAVHRGDCRAILNDIY